ncbi:MAG: hypothetical protein LBU68_00225 [Rickettsiales bacterium]|nr:hypothetical protein [Rickettsiales bacterium]
MIKRINNNFAFSEDKLQNLRKIFLISGIMFTISISGINNANAQAQCLSSCESMSSSGNSFSVRNDKGEVFSVSIPAGQSGNAESYFTELKNRCKATCKTDTSEPTAPAIDISSIDEATARKIVEKGLPGILNSTFDNKAVKANTARQ